MNIKLNTWTLTDDLGFKDIKVYEFCILLDKDKLSFKNLSKVVNMLEEKFFWHIPTEFDIVENENYMYILYDIKFVYGEMSDIDNDFKDMKKEIKKILKTL